MPWHWQIVEQLITALCVCASAYVPEDHEHCIVIQRSSNHKMRNERRSTFEGIAAFSIFFYSIVIGERVAFQLIILDSSMGAKKAIICGGNKRFHLFGIETCATEREKITIITKYFCSKNEVMTKTKWFVIFYACISASSQMNGEVLGNRLRLHQIRNSDSGIVPTFPSKREK